MLQNQRGIWSGQQDSNLRQVLVIAQGDSDNRECRRGDGRAKPAAILTFGLYGAFFVKEASRHFCRPLSFHFFVRPSPRAFFRPGGIRHPFVRLRWMRCGMATPIYFRRDIDLAMLWGRSLIYPCAHNRCTTIYRPASPDAIALSVQHTFHKVASVAPSPSRLFRRQCVADVQSAAVQTSMTSWASDTFFQDRGARVDCLS